MNLAGRTDGRLVARLAQAAPQLVPFGHLLRRLPAGNVGRSTASAFRPMAPPPDVAVLVRWARQA